ncbi:hypothetical protein ACQEWB_34465 [Streptomyces sp. CA-249302]|uniref:hypothetical protein n=1 Tax=Streptomyces sp. CA-249302 TaxID=3240058 RepID=UPI003D8FCE99
MHVWDIGTGEQRPRIRYHPMVLAADFSPDGTHLATVGGGKAWLFPVALPERAFLGGVGGRLAEDAYRRLRELVRRPTPAVAARPIVLQDTVTGILVVLGPEADEEGYRKLSRAP